MLISTVTRIIKKWTCGSVTQRLVDYGVYSSISDKSVFLSIHSMPYGERRRKASVVCDYYMAGFLH